MLFSYDKETPDWALGEEYDHCRNLTEKKILRVLLTWLFFVNQRYVYTRPTYGHYITGVAGCLRNSNMEKRYRKIANALPDDKDPAYFVAYIFETWDMRKNYAIYVREGIENYSGLAFPSLKYICTNARGLVKGWLAIPHYKPKDFVPFDDMKKNDTKSVESKVTRWCIAHDKKPAQFWTNPRAVQLLDARYMKCSTSLLQCREEVEKYWECTVEEFIDFMLALQGEIEEKEDELFLITKTLNDERVKRGYKREYANLFTLEDE